VKAKDLEKKCNEICPYCRDGIALRQRSDTLEWTHDGSIAIPGTLGRRQSHVICSADKLRSENESNGK
jgi:hypothetical protein